MWFCPIWVGDELAVFPRYYWLDPLLSLVIGIQMLMCSIYELLGGEPGFVMAVEELPESQQFDKDVDW